MTEQMTVGHGEQVFVARECPECEGAGEVRVRLFDGWDEMVCGRCEGDTVVADLSRPVAGFRQQSNFRRAYVDKLERDEAERRERLRSAADAAPKCETERRIDAKLAEMDAMLEELRARR